jgi:hypothetical protein
LKDFEDRKWKKRKEKKRKEKEVGSAYTAFVFYIYTHQKRYNDFGEFS